MTPDVTPADRTLADLAAFLTARWDELERWALAASTPFDRAATAEPSEGVHWYWGTGPDWEPTEPTPTGDPIEGATLLTREQWPTRWGQGTLPGYSVRMDELPASVAGHITMHDPAAVLADLAAKRALLGHLQLLTDLRWLGRVGYPYSIREEARAAMKSLALPFADHPGYQPDFRKDARGR